MEYLKKIISGAQTGADRAGLDFAISNGIRHGGWVPKGRIAEDGIVPLKYNVKEHKSEKYPPRTAANIHDADVTIIFTGNVLERGCLLTANLCKSMNKPYLIINIEEMVENSTFSVERIKIITWLDKIKPKILNIAGSRESKLPGIYKRVKDLLQAVYISY
jgi:hypothetical protein